jgi:hypothetical protein
VATSAPLVPSAADERGVRGGRCATQRKAAGGGGGSKEAGAADAAVLKASRRWAASGCWARLAALQRWVADVAAAAAAAGRVRAPHRAWRRARLARASVSVGIRSLVCMPHAACCMLHAHWRQRQVQQDASCTLARAQGS